MTGSRRLVALSFFPILLTLAAVAQSLGGPGISGPPDSKFTSTRSGTAPFDVSASGLTELNARMLMWGDQQASPLQNPHLLSSKLDAKAPAKARQAFEKGYEALYRKDYQQAVIQLLAAIDIYPAFVAAHQGLGAAYLAVGKNVEARDEFAQAVVLDNRMPSSYFGLGRAELELKHFGSAELAEQKAAALAPLDLKVLSILAYAQLMNRDFEGAIRSAEKVHTRKDPGHAMIHFYAAAAWEGQKDVPNAISELHAFLKEDSKSDAALQARDLLAKLELEPANNSIALQTAAAEDDLLTSRQRAAAKALDEQIHRETDKQEVQVTEAEAICESCAEAKPERSSEHGTRAPAHRPENGWTLHSNVDEVAVFFVATDHGGA